ncbi:helix-turn-helix transcriptional regulator [Aeromonas molluscorum]|jgi:DNA-binding CsgD family transcriptional regulator|uniref:Response regulator n=1 Tax=Aeromonas molluscorum 848 TaxID=1268236 RepID=R1F4L7_9GAMM|nr:helix-turn-helix transcriptional regulator [Aeromonas molluscorum]EOD54818.1 response regulator [Aeromonas molluscorum 848]
MSNKLTPIDEQGLCHQLLARNDIYFISFDEQEQVVASSYPVDTLTLNRLDDLVFLVGPDYLKAIRQRIRGNLPALHFEILNLAFELFAHDGASGSRSWCLQIKPSDSQDASGIEQDHRLINELGHSLAALSGTEGAAPGEQHQQLIARHLPEVEQKLAQIQDPALKMCLELIRTSMEKSLRSLQEEGNQRLLEVLTPSEMQVAEFIRSGMSSQEIASALNVARKTVENHRNSVRIKLGLANRGVNLRNYLLSLEK